MFINMPFKNAECGNLQFLQGYFTEVYQPTKLNETVDRIWLFKSHAALTCEQAFLGKKIEKTIKRIYLRQT